MQLARAKNAFLCYKKMPCTKMADFVIARSDQQIATGKKMAELEKTLDRELKQAKIETLYMAMARAGDFSELPNFLNTISTDQNNYENDSELEFKPVLTLH
jgi:hypothetical protein